METTQYYVTAEIKPNGDVEIIRIEDAPTLEHAHGPACDHVQFMRRVNQRKPPYGTLETKPLLRALAAWPLPVLKSIAGMRYGFLGQKTADMPRGLRPLKGDDTIVEAVNRCALDEASDDDRILSARRIAESTQPNGFTWQPISEQRYVDLLGCVPPQAYLPHMFLVGENMGEDPELGEKTYTACLRGGDKHFMSSRPITEREFWAMEPESPADKLLTKILRAEPRSVTFEIAARDLLDLVAGERGPTFGRHPQDLSTRLRAKLGDCVMADPEADEGWSEGTELMVRLIKALRL